MSGKTWVNNHAHVLRFDDYCMQQYVEHYLNYTDLAAYINKNANPKLTQEKLEGIQFLEIHGAELLQRDLSNVRCHMVVDVTSVSLMAGRSDFDFADILEPFVHPLLHRVLARPGERLLLQNSITRSL